jgi:hypothetical protein
MGAPRASAADVLSGRDRLESLARSPHFMDWSDARGAMEHASGCPRREPFLDDRLVEMTAGMPPLALFAGGRLRGALREALRGRVPEVVRLRKTKAKFGPASGELVAPLGGVQALRDLARPVALADHGMVDPDVFRERFALLEQRPDDSGMWRELWPVLSAERLLRGASETVTSFTR